jgi:outer membrane protein assembly factor BamA
LFAAVGNVWLLTPGTAATSEATAIRDIFDPILRYSIGAGIRVSTPVGPLQVDLAANPEAITATGERRILLRDQWREPLLRAHISLGTLF